VTDTRGRILDAAWSLATRHGLSSVTLRQVAEESKVSRQAVYLHFQNRAGLLVAMARHHDQTSGFAAEVALATKQEPVAAIEALVLAWLDYLPGILPVARALEASEINQDEGGDAFQDRMAEWHRVLASAMRRVADAGALRSGWTHGAAADWLWAQVHPSAWQRLVVERGWSARQFADRTWASCRRELLAG
jgi:AcrR family transcriptional regulator